MFGCHGPVDAALSPRTRAVRRAATAELILHSPMAIEGKMIRHMLVLLILPLSGPLAGCATAPVNPSFPLTVAQARQDLDAMARNPVTLHRPVLILGAFMDPGYTTSLLDSHLRRVTNNGRFATIKFADCNSFDECRRRLIETALVQFPNSDARQTAEFDVVAASMGGLVARYAAKPGAEPRRLRIVQLFTIASPHRGAILAVWPSLLTLAQQMRPGSDFLQQLNTPPIAHGYQILPYVWINDSIVGAGNAAPPGQSPWWLPPIPLENPHIGAMDDPRIIADIARRLRGETPYTINPPTPLPPGATAMGP